MKNSRVLGKGPLWPKLLGYAAWFLAGAFFLAGQGFIFSERIKEGGLLALAGVVVAALRLVLPQVPWAALFESLKNAGKAAREAGQQAKFKVKPGLALSKLGEAGGRSSGALKLWWEKIFPDDTLRISRHWLWLPAGLFLALMQVYLFRGQMTRGAVFLIGAAVFVSVYLQELHKPLAVPNLATNLRSLLSMALALPLQVAGFLMLWSYHRVWTGYLLTVLGSAWMLWSLKRWPLNLEEEEDQGALSLSWSPPQPFFATNSLAVKASLVAAACLCAFLSLQVLGPAFAGMRVALGFLGVFLLVGSFPWLPHGLADWDRVPKLWRALGALGLALFAFFLASHAQNLMELGRKGSALWQFLFAGIFMVLAISRFDGLDSIAPVVKPDSPQEGEAAAPPAPWAKWAEILFLGVLLLSSFQFRAWNIDTFPYGAEGDEAGGGVWAMDALKGRVEHPLIHQNYPLHFFSVTAVFFKFFGVSLATMRWHSVIFGTLSLAAAYFFARLFLGRWVAFFSTLLMSFAYWHLHYSRFGHYNIEQVFAQTVAFYFVFKGMLSGRRTHFIAGGMAFALAMFPHMAGRLLPFQGIIFLVYLFLARRDLMRRRASGLLAFVIASWMIASPAVTYWLRATAISMGRIQSVSIFDKNNTNAPIDVLAGFVQNTKISFLMFNDYSDSRHRDNPLAPQKILEHWSAILFALAFLFVIYHWREPLNFLLLTAFLINLCASIFSVEAPQTLRTAGNIPIVFMMMAVMLAHLQRSLRGLGSRPGTVVFAALMLLSMPFFSYRSWQKFFVEARNLGFDVLPTYVAMKAGKEGKKEDQAVFWGTGFASSHPPVQLFAEETPIRNFYSLNEYLPVSEAADRNHLLFLVDDYGKLLSYLTSLYPGARQEPIENLQGGGPLAQYVYVTKEQLQSIQGMKLDARDALGASTRIDGAPLEFPNPKIPASAKALHFKGSMKLDYYGSYEFKLSGQGDATVRVAGKTVYSRSGGAVSARPANVGIGLTPLEVDFRPRSATDKMELTLIGTPPDLRGFYALRGPLTLAISSRRVFQVEPQGFFGSYYATRDLKGPVVTDGVDPLLYMHWLDSPVSGNWSVKWLADLRVETPGAYQFRMEGLSTEVKIDGRLVWRGGAPLLPEMSPPRIDGSPNLSKGTHRIEAVFSTNGPPMVSLTWRRPDGVEEVIPANLCRPVFPN